MTWDVHARVSSGATVVPIALHATLLIVQGLALILTSVPDATQFANKAPQVTQLATLMSRRGEPTIFMSIFMAFV